MADPRLNDKSVIEGDDALLTDPVTARAGLQYTEYWHKRSGITMSVDRVLFQDKSDFQEVGVYQTHSFGRLLTLDGVVMFTDYDEFVYHEMIAHPALTLLGDPKRILIIGGGDGGAAREMLKHPTVEHIDLVDIDEMVVTVSKRFFPQISSSFNDPRLKLHIADGIAFVKESHEPYDLIIVDSTDPVGVAEGLFTRAFYEDCLNLLTERGIIAVQSESPFDPVQKKVPGEVRKFFADLFPIAETYLAYIPFYPMGMWSFTFGSRKLHPVRDFDRAAAEKHIAPFADSLKYYTPDLHTAAFTLPAFVKRLVE